MWDYTFLAPTLTSSFIETLVQVRNMHTWCNRNWNFFIYICLVVGTCLHLHSNKPVLVECPAEYIFVIAGYIHDNIACAHETPSHTNTILPTTKILITQIQKSYNVIVSDKWEISQICDRERWLFQVVFFSNDLKNPNIDIHTIYHGRTLMLCWMMWYCHSFLFDFKCTLQLHSSRS